MKESIAQSGNRRGECVHCLGSGWMLDKVETTFDEYEDVFYVCRKCGPSDPEPPPETPKNTPDPRGESRREASARKLFRRHASEFIPLDGARYLAPSRTEAGIRYEVDVEAETCGCPDQRLRQRLRGSRCSHIIACGLYMETELARARKKAGSRPVGEDPMPSPEETAPSIAGPGGRA